MIIQGITEEHIVLHNSHYTVNMIGLLRISGSALQLNME